MSDIKNKKLTQFNASIAFLAEALAVEKSRISTAAVVQAFEMCLEQAWKWQKFCLEELGVLTNAPKEVIRMAGRNAIIDNVEIWIEFLDARNLTSHTYNIETGDRVYEIAKEFYQEVVKLTL